MPDELEETSTTRTKLCKQCQRPFQVVARGFASGGTASYCDTCRPKPRPKPAVSPTAVPAPPPIKKPRKSDVARASSGRRRGIDPTTCDREYTEPDVEFMKAMDRYKRENRRPFPTCSEVLEVLVSLGYRKVAQAGPLPGAK